MQTLNHPTTTTPTQAREGAAPTPPELPKSKGEGQQPMLQITREEWSKTHRDFKTTIAGQRYVLRLTDRGTCLVPVIVAKGV